VLAHGRVVGVELEMGGAPKDLAEDHLRFQTRERGADTEVNAPPEGVTLNGRRDRRKSSGAGYRGWITGIWMPGMFRRPAMSARAEDSSARPPTWTRKAPSREATSEG